MCGTSYDYGLVSNFSRDTKATYPVSGIILDATFNSDSILERCYFISIVKVPFENKFSLCYWLCSWDDYPDLQSLDGKEMPFFDRDMLSRT